MFARGRCLLPHSTHLPVWILKFANLICMLICMTLPWYSHLMVGGVEHKQQFHCEGLVRPSCFLPLRDASPAMAKAWPRLQKRHTYTPFHDFSSWEGSLESIYANYHANFHCRLYYCVLSECGCKIYFIINVHSKDFNKCLREHLFPRGSAGPMEAFVQREACNVLSALCAWAPVDTVNTTFRR